MNTIKTLALLLFFSAYAYALNIEIRVDESVQKVINKKIQIDIKELLHEQLRYFEENTIVTIDNSNKKEFKEKLRKQNKTFLQEYTKNKNISVLVLLSYSKSARSIRTRVYLNDGQNSEKTNYTVVTAITPLDLLVKEEVPNKKIVTKEEDQEYKNISIFAISITSSIMQNINELNILNYNKRKI